MIDRPLSDERDGVPGPSTAAGAGATTRPAGGTRITPLTKLRVPLGGQEIELQQLDYEAGGISLLRTRIREKSRFTVFEIDAATASQWGEALLRWAQAQPSNGETEPAS